jgi:oligoribonuclease
LGERVGRKDNLIWIDLEMTGLIPEQHRIIEIATAVTDKELTVLAEGPVLAIHQSDEVLASMDEWNTRQHTNSGLAERVRSSEVSESDAEQQTLAFLRQHVDQGASPICGNSICQDRRFLIRHMPELAAYFHYRNLDVSTLKILAKLWLPEVSNRFEKKSVHLALADIHDSRAPVQTLSRRPRTWCVNPVQGGFQWACRSARLRPTGRFARM